MICPDLWASPKWVPFVPGRYECEVGKTSHLETNPHNPLIRGLASFNSNGISTEQQITNLIEDEGRQLIKREKHPS